MTEAIQAVLCSPRQYRRVPVETPLEGPLIPGHQRPGRLQPDPWVRTAVQLTAVQLTAVQLTALRWGCLQERFQTPV